MERVVLLGAGGFGRCWTPALAAHADRVEVVGVVEPDPAERERAVREFALPRHRGLASARDGLAVLDATVAIDSSPFVHRRDNAMLAFHAGLDLLAAKPLGTALDDAQAIVAAAAAGSRSVAVVQQMRYFPCFLALRDAIGGGRYGAVRAVDVRMALDGRGWQPGMAWRLALAHPLLLEAGIHHFDLLRWCLASEFDTVATVEWNPPWSPFRSGATVAALLRTTAGVPVSYAATFAPHPDQAPVRFDSGWTVVCDRAVLTVRDGGLFADGQPLAAAPLTPEPVPLEELNDSLLEVWLTARRTGAGVPFDGADNLRSMAMVQRAIAAVERAGVPG